MKIIYVILSLLLATPAFADSKLSALSNNSSPSSTDLTYDVASGTSYNVTLAQLMSLFFTPNVGIGSTAPGAALDVQGTVRAIQFVKLGGTSSQFLKADGSVDSSTYLTSDLWTSSGGDVYRSSGNVGVGSTNPGKSLDVQGTIRMAGFNLSTSPTNGYVLTADGSGNGSWQASSGGGSGNVGIGTTNRVVIQIASQTTGTPANINVDSNSNLGIGSTTPGQALDVQGTIRTTGFLAGTSSQLNISTNGNVSTSGSVSADSGFTSSTGGLNATSGQVLAERVTVSSSSNGSTSQFTTTTSSGNNTTAITSSATNSANIGSIQSYGISATGAISGNSYNGSTNPPAIGVYGIGKYTGSGTVPSTKNIYGVYGQCQNTGSGTTTNCMSIYGDNPLASSGSITNSWAGYFNGPVYSLGNVSIGTTSVSKLLTIGSTGQATIDSSGNEVVSNLTSSKILDNGTNVGIGSATPGQQLDVNGTVRAIQFTIRGGTSSQFLKADGSTDSSTYSTAVGANPTATVDTSAVNGSSANFMRADGAPAINLTMSPTWTGNHTFTPSSGNTLFSAGNIGIGTAIPGAKLDVEGSLSTVLFQSNIGVGTLTPALGIGTSNPKTGYVEINMGAQGDFGQWALAVLGNNNGSATLGANNANILSKNINSQGFSEYDAENNSGSSGIAAFGVAGTTASAAGINGPAGYIYTGGTLPFYIETNYTVNNAPAIAVTSGGNIGMGTSLPSQLFEVGARKLDVTSGGNVGVGSINPGQILDVQGTVRATGFTGNLDNGTFTDVTSNNASTSNHGFLPKLDNTSTHFLNGQGSFTTPSGSGTVNSGTVNRYSYYAATGTAVSDQTLLYTDGTNVGVGTAGPSSLFDVNRKLNVFSGGNIGISSITPGQMLDVQGTVRSLGFVDTALTASRPVISDASKNLISGSYSGNTTTLATTSGSLTNGDGMKFDANGNIIDSGSAVAAGTVASGTIGRDAIYTGSTTVGSGIINDNGTNIGIGTAAFKNTLNILGNIGVGTTNGDSYLTTSAPNGGAIIYGNVGIGTWLPGAQFQVGGTGNVGIGTTILSSGLTVGTSNGVSIGTSYTNGISAPSNGLIVLGNVGIGTWLPSQLFEAGTQKFDITSGGNIGIGTISPQSGLTLGGNKHLGSTGTAPTVASNDCGSTSQGTISSGSTDLRGSVVVGTLTVTSCAVTFNTAFGIAPFCITQDDTNILGTKNTQTTTKLTITSTTSMSNDTVSWVCIE